LHETTVRLALALSDFKQNIDIDNVKKISQDWLKKTSL